MGYRVTIDSHSGFCPGVIHAIEQAELLLGDSRPLYSLGAIVHNNEELQRLERSGLKVITATELTQLPPHSRVLIRAHGEPPQTYLTAREQQLEIIECTCPVVLKLQQHIKKEYERLQPLHGTLLIFGKRGHAEVNALVGQTGGGAVVIETAAEVSACNLSNGPVSLFSQTTKDPEAYEALRRSVGEAVVSQGGDISRFTCFHTICRQVSGRTAVLREFALAHGVILFVSGRESSNGRVLFEICRSVNPRSYSIEKESDISPLWFNPQDSVGICGATSTPKWLMRRVAQRVAQL